MQLAPPNLGYADKKSGVYHHVFKSIESLEGDHGMDRRHYAVPFKGISIKSTPEIVLSLNETNYKKGKMKGTPDLKWPYHLFNKSTKWSLFLDLVTYREGPAAEPE